MRLNGEMSADDELQGVSYSLTIIRRLISSPFFLDYHQGQVMGCSSRPASQSRSTISPSSPHRSTKQQCTSRPSSESGKESRETFVLLHQPRFRRPRPHLEAVFPPRARQDRIASSPTAEARSRGRRGLEGVMPGDHRYLRLGSFPRILRIISMKSEGTGRQGLGRRRLFPTAAFRDLIAVRPASVFRLSGLGHRKGELVPGDPTGRCPLTIERARL